MLGVLSACEDQPSIELVPVFPQGENNLLGDVAYLEIVPVLVEGQTATPEQPIIVKHGAAMSIKGLAEGTWRFQIRGLDEQDYELVYGQTKSFQVSAGSSKKVPFFLGRSFEFNLAPIVESSSSAELASFVDHAAISFEDESGDPWILVAGGRKSIEDEPSDEVFLINTLNYTIESLRPGLTCNRAGHSAFSIDTDDGLRIVFAGGDAECPGTLDVFDPVTREFSNVKAECMTSSTQGALAQTKSGIQTGNVVIPGAPMCTIDPLDGHQIPSKTFKLTDQDLVSITPKRATATAVNRLGQMVIVADDAVFIDSNDVDRGSCGYGDAWKSAAVFDGFSFSDGAELVPLNNDSFLLVGETSLKHGESNFGWTLIRANQCEFQSIVEGSHSDVLPDWGFALIDIVAGNDALVFATGGREQGASPSDQVALFYNPLGSLAPSWHNLSGTNDHHISLKLRAQRAGHATVKLPNGSTWLIGGRDKTDKPVEIFVRGSSVKNPFVSHEETFYRRDPALTTMLVLDTTAGTRELLTSFAETYPLDIFEATRGPSELFLFASADRGISDDLLPEDYNGKLANCAATDIDQNSEVQGLAWGTEDGSWLAIDNNPAPSGGPGSNGDSGRTLYSGKIFPHTGDLTSEPQEAEARQKLLDFIEDEDEGCPWRQLIRVGLDGLSCKYGQNQKPETTGINMLVWVTSGDDCSQGVFQGPIIKPTTYEIQDGILEVCGADALDEYFVPTETSGLLENMANSIVDDPKDLIIAVVGATGTDSDSCGFGAGLTLERPRRLLNSIEDVGVSGASIANLDVCGRSQLDSSMFSELKAVIAGRNLHQSCIPAATAALTEIQDVPKIGGGSNVRPIAVDSITNTEHSDVAKTVASKLADRCSVVYVSSDSDDAIYHKVESLKTDADGGWYIKSNTDQRGICENDWLVALDGFVSQDSLERYAGAAIVCID
jgi:hypothetical protein